MLEQRRCGPQKLSEQIFCKTKFVSANTPSYNVEALRIASYFFLEVISYKGLNHATVNSLHKKIR